MSIPVINARRAKELIDKGAVLVDIREADEHAREHVPGARHQALSRLAKFDPAGAKAVIFHCRSGARTQANAPRLAAAVGCEAYILEGGIDAWKKAGLPTTMLLFSFMGTDTSYPVLLIPMFTLATGMGLTMSPLTASIMSAVPMGKAGVGSAMNDTTRELGGALGVAVLGSLVASRYDGRLSSALVGLPAAVGALAGTSLQQRVRTSTLTYGFALLLAVVGVVLLTT